MICFPVTIAGVDGGEQSFSDQGYEPVTLNEPNELDSPRMIASKNNENVILTDLPGNKSFTLDLEFFSPPSTLVALSVSDNADSDGLHLNIRHRNHAMYSGVNGVTISNVKPDMRPKLSVLTLKQPQPVILELQIHPSLRPLKMLALEPQTQDMQLSETNSFLTLVSLAMLCLESPEILIVKEPSHITQVT